MLAPTLSTERLTLRGLTMADWEAYATMWADPRVTRFIGGEPRPRDIAWKSFGQAAGMWALFDYGNWAVISASDSAFLGVVGFSFFDRGMAELDGYAEAGWVFTPDSWGRGIGAEAVGAIHDWADTSGLGETRCLIDAENTGSISIARRVGYVQLATLPKGGLVLRRPSPAAQ